jgi:hypothetical protein
MKQSCNCLKILKDKKNIDSDGLVDYIFEWYDGEILLASEKRKIDLDFNFNPIENYSIDDLIEHKKICCFDIDILNITIEEIEKT